MSSEMKGEYKVITLANGDKTVTRGSWILIRLFVKTGKILEIAHEAPYSWIIEAKKLVLEESKGGVKWN